MSADSATNTPIFPTALILAAMACMVLLPVLSFVMPAQTVHAEETCTTVAIDVGAPDEKPDQPGIQVCSSGDDVKDNVIYVYLKAFINFLAVGVGVAVAVSIAVAGFQYITSEGNPQKLSLAKNRLFHAIVALVLFILMYTLLQFLIPGGLV